MRDQRAFGDLVIDIAAIAGQKPDVFDPLDRLAFSERIHALSLAVAVPAN
jgi:acid stress-induced BolA-like protein IbaG/YrbA